MNIGLTLFGQSLIFGIFVWFCMKYIWPPLKGMMRERQEAIAQGLAAAEDAEKKLGCNGLVLNKKTMIVGDDMPELARALRAEGTEVLTARIDGIYWQGGGFRCWHHPLVRRSKLEA